MQLESVKELQKQASHLIEEQLITKQSCDSRGVGLLIPPAIGIHINGENDYKLAVHLQSKLLLDYVQPICELARGEVDIQITGIIKKQNLWRKRHRPLRIGVSISHYEALTEGTGSLGCFVRKKGQSELLILSNNHVLANENNAKIGDPILQPGIHDNCDMAKDVIGYLQEYIKIETSRVNLADVALARVESCFVENLAFLESSLCSLKGVYQGEIKKGIPKGISVRKIGRGTGLTKGKISNFNMVIRVNYGTILEPRFYRFKEIITIEGEEKKEAFGKEGDSGSLIVDTQGNAIALYFAGSELGGWNDCGISYAIPIDTVLNELDVDLVCS